MANYYTTVAGAGDNSGDSWANAMTISEFETLVEGGGALAAGDYIYVAGGTYTCPNTIDASVNAAVTAKISVIGVNSGTTNEPPISSDWATGTNRPLFDLDSGKQLILDANYWNIHNIRVDGAYLYGPILTASAYGYVENCYAINVANNTSAHGMSGGSYTSFVSCEAVSTYAWGIYQYKSLINCYIHDSVYGIRSTSGSMAIGCIIDTCSTRGIDIDTVNGCLFMNNTIYNCGVGIFMENTLNYNNVIINNSITDCTNGFAGDYSGTPQPGFVTIDYNNWYNNTRDMSWDNGSSADNSLKGPNDIAANPSYTDAAGGDFTPTAGIIDTGLTMSLGVG